jgi:hypothetical protein
MPRRVVIPFFAPVCDRLDPVALDVKSPIKSICCMVWILGALLMIATLDKIPDPPAANPKHAQISASCLDKHSVAARTLCVSIDALFHLPVRIVVADAVELLPYSDQIVLVERAADSSPPLPQS